MSVNVVHTDMKPTWTIFSWWSNLNNNSKQIRLRS